MSALRQDGGYFSVFGKPRTARSPSVAAAHVAAIETGQLHVLWVYVPVGGESRWLQATPEE